MGFIESDSFDFSDIGKFFSDLFLNRLEVFLTFGLLGVDYVLEDDYLESFSFIFHILIPGKELFLDHFALDLLCERMLFSLSGFVVVLFLVELGSFNSDYEPTSDFIVVQVLDRKVHALLLGVGDSCVSFGKTTFISINF